MKPAARIISTILVALTFGTTVPTVCARAAEHPSWAQAGTIAPNVWSTVEFAVETTTSRLVPANGTQHRSTVSFAPPSWTDVPRLRAVLAERSATRLADAGEREPIRGRAPPV